MQPKRFLSIILALAMTLCALTPVAAKSAESVTIDTRWAEADAKLHRTDGIAKGEAKPGTKPSVSKPNRIAITLKGDPATTRAFRWYSEAKGDGVVLISSDPNMKNPVEIAAAPRRVTSHYLERDAKGFFRFGLYDKATKKRLRTFTDENRKAGEWDQNKEVKDAEKEYVAIDVQKVEEITYSAEATGLTPGTTYYYQVGTPGNLSEIGSFRTAKGNDAPFRFLHYTDTQNAFWNEHLIDEGWYCANTLEMAMKTIPDADFTLHTGDIVEVAEVEDEWKDLFEQSRSSFLRTTLVPVPGNHDEYGLDTKERFPHKYTDHFNVPAAGPDDGGTYYSFDYNGTHFIVANTNDYKNDAKKALGETQLDWIRADVKNARARGVHWVILCYHKPLFSKSYHSLEDADVQNVREDFMKLIDELDIDLCLQGHDHVISRTKSLRFAPKSETPFCAKVAEEAVKKDGIDVLTSPKGTTFVLPNTGGTKAYDDIYDKGLAHVKKVRPKLSWLTEDLLKEYLSLFAFGEQPQKSPRYAKSHSNFRDSTIQNFSDIKVTKDAIEATMYQIEGKKGEKRTVKAVDRFILKK